MILIFAGAGASAAVNSKKYPTTAEYYNRLPADIKVELENLSEGKFIKNVISNSLDVENILWDIKEIKQSIQELTRAEKKATSIFLSTTTYKGTRKFLGNDLKQLSSLEKRINAHVYELYRQLPEEKEVQNWINLLGLSQYSLDDNRSVVEHGIEIFTTNYDPVFDYLSNSFEIETGFRLKNAKATLDIKTWSEDFQNNKRMRLTNLHGSVSWSRDAGGNIINGDTHPSDGRDNVILYPGYKGIPEDQPFHSFHAHFIRMCEQAQIFIFVGFSFRDGFILNSFLAPLIAKGRKPQIFIVDLEKNRGAIEDALKYDENVIFMGDGFKVNTANKILEELKKNDP